MKVTYTRVTFGKTLEESTFDVPLEDKDFFPKFQKYLKSSVKRWDDITSRYSVYERSPREKLFSRPRYGVYTHGDDSLRAR